MKSQMERSEFKNYRNIWPVKANILMVFTITIPTLA